MSISSKHQAARWAAYAQPEEPPMAEDTRYTDRPHPEEQLAADDPAPTSGPMDLHAELARPFPPKVVQTIGAHNARYVPHGQLTQRMLQLGLQYDWEVLEVNEEPDGFWCLGRLTVHWPVRQDGRTVLGLQVITEASDLEGTPAAASSRCYARALRHIGLGLHLWCEGNNGGYWLAT